jgi:hypothetical protein
MVGNVNGLVALLLGAFGLLVLLMVAGIWFSRCAQVKKLSEIRAASVRPSAEWQWPARQGAALRRLAEVAETQWLWWWETGMTRSLA